MPTWKELRAHCLDTAILAYMKTGECSMAWFNTVLDFTKENLKMAK